MAAYQSLGPFISTFADPSASGFSVSDDGTLCEYTIRESEVQTPPVQTEAEPTVSQNTEPSSDQT